MSRRTRPRQPLWQQQLLEYAEGVHQLALPATREALASAETRLGRPLHPSHRAWLERHDGATLFHDAYRIFGCAELVDDRFGEEGESDLALDAGGRVLRVEIGAQETLVAGSSLDRWLDALFAREALAYDRDGEFRDVFEDDGLELRPEVMRKREERAVRCDPESPAARFELGRLLARDGRLGSAEAELVRATELDPTFKWAYFELGRLRRRAGRNVEAIESFMAAATADPSDGPLFYAWAARVAEERGDRALAARLRARVRLLDAGFAQRHKDVGKKLLEEGDPRAAADMLSLALAVDHHDGEARELLSKARASS